MNLHTIHLDLPTSVFARKDTIPVTRRYRCNDEPVITELLAEVEDSFWLDWGPKTWPTDPRAITIGYRELTTLMEWAQIQLRPAPRHLWEDTKVQMYRWDNTEGRENSAASRVCLLREEHKWKLCHVEYFTPAQFQAAWDDGLSGSLHFRLRRSNSMRLERHEHLRSIVAPLCATEGLFKASLRKGHIALGYDKYHPANNKLMDKAHRKRILPKAVLDTARLDWLTEHIAEADVSLRDFIDRNMAENTDPKLYLVSPEF